MTRQNAEIAPRLHDAVRARSALERAALSGDGLLSAAACRVEDMSDDSQAMAEDLVTTFEHPPRGSDRGFTRPVKFGRTPGPQPFAAATPGQHADEVLAAMATSARPIER